MSLLSIYSRIFMLSWSGVLAQSKRDGGEELLLGADLLTIRQLFWVALACSRYVKERPDGHMNNYESPLFHKNNHHFFNRNLNNYNIFNEALNCKREISGMQSS